MTTATFILASTLLVGQTDQFINFFTPCEYRRTSGANHNELFRYRLFVPRPLKPTEKYPLLVWLHGVGEAGSDNRLSLRYLDSMLDDSDHAQKYRLFILVVQCPQACPVWFHTAGAADSGAGGPNDMLTVTAEILRKTMREYPVDQDRIYLAGLSSGGNGCWEMAMRYPELFAAVVPMASGAGRRIASGETGEHSDLGVYQRRRTPRRGEYCGGSGEGGRQHSLDHSATGRPQQLDNADARRHPAVDAGPAPPILVLDAAELPSLEMVAILSLPAGFMAIVWAAWRWKQRRRQMRAAAVCRSRH